MYVAKEEPQNILPPSSNWIGSKYYSRRKHQPIFWRREDVINNLYAWKLHNLCHDDVMDDCILSQRNNQYFMCVSVRIPRPNHILMRNTNYGVVVINYYKKFPCMRIANLKNSKKPLKIIKKLHISIDYFHQYNHIIILFRYFIIIFPLHFIRFS